MLDEVIVKREYIISLVGESSGATTRMLSDDEYELIRGIFEECDSQYVGGLIEQLPDSGELYRKMNIGERELFECGTLYSELLQMGYVSLVADEMSRRLFVMWKVTHSN